MFSKLLAGSVVALRVGQAYAGYAWSGVNMGGFDFGCTTDVSTAIILVRLNATDHVQGNLHT